jgi:hypothetical protein
LDRWLR